MNVILFSLILKLMGFASVIPQTDKESICPNLLRTYFLLPSESCMKAIACIALTYLGHVDRLHICSISIANNVFEMPYLRHPSLGCRESYHQRRYFFRFCLTVTRGWNPAPCLSTPGTILPRRTPTPLEVHNPMAAGHKMWRFHRPRHLSE